MASWSYGKLAKCRVGEATSGQNGKLAKWQVGETTQHPQKRMDSALQYSLS